MVEKDLNQLSAVYSIVNKVNGKQYIGSTSDVSLRMKDHLLKIRNKTHYVQEFNEIDIDDIEIRILEHDLSPKCLLDKEYHYINHFKTFDKNIGFNTMKNKLPQTTETRKTSPLSKSLQSKLKISKLTLEDVKSIKIQLSQGKRIFKIAEDFNCNKSTIQSIKTCSIWKDVLPELNEELKALRYYGIHSGENNSSSKLKETDIKDIKEKIGKGMFLSLIAKEYGVSRTLISKIKKGELWSHIFE
ncbi:GIY-YIG nuclease family protein [Bacillus safensis]|uniref:GIY-YIG nuclease family protein n=1 Tax=Bacillus safensis TaxID=561879 RepID=UPI00351763F6